MNELKKAALLSYVNIILVNTIGIFLTPFIIRTLGNSEYGLYTLIGSFIAYLSLMDFGLNNTIIRFVSKYRVENQKNEEKLFLGSVMIIYLFISISILFLGLFIYFRIDYFFGKSLLPSQINDFKIMFLILLFNMCIAVPGGSFMGICTAYEKYVFPSVVMIIKYVLRTIVVIVILLLGKKSISLVIIDTIFNIFVICITLFYCLFKLKIKFSFQNKKIKNYITILSYSIWIFFIGLIQSFQWNAGQIILGINVNTKTVAIFSVGIMLGSYFGAFAGVINNLLLPKAAKLSNDENSEIMINNNMVFIGRINSFICFLILSIFLLIGKEFIVLWVGKEFIKSWEITLLIMSFTFIPMIQSLGVSILEIRNKIKYRSLGMLLSMSLAVMLSSFFVKKYGIDGVLFPILIGMFLNIIINNYLFVKHFSFNYIVFFKKTIFFQSIYTTLIVLLFYYLKYFFVIKTWFNIVLFSFIFIIVFVLFFIVLFFNDEEKKLFKLKN